MKKILLAFWLHLCYVSVIAQLPTTCERALEIQCGETYDFNIDPADFSDGPSTICQGSTVNALWLKINGTGDIYDFKVCDQSYTDIFLVSGSCENQSCQQLLNSAIFYDCPYTFQGRFKSVEAETYYILIVINYLDTRVLSFSLQCAQPAINDECEESQPIDVGVTYEINTLSASVGIQPSCSFIFESGDLWYQFVGSGDFISFNSSSALVNATLYEGTCSHLNCLPQASIGFQVGYITEPEKIYYLQVRMYGNDQHNFSLTKHDIAPDSYCQNASDLPIREAFAIDFSDVIYTNGPCEGIFRGHKWFTIMGNDSLIRILFGQNIPEVMSGDCNLNRCERLTVAGNWISFMAKKGVRYYIAFPADANFESYAFFSFHEVINDSYEDALPLSCGDEVGGSLLGALYDPGFPLNLSGAPDVWYRIVGSGRFYQFSSQDVTSSGVLGRSQVEVFEIFGNQLQPHFQGFLGDGIYNYLLFDQSIYYVRVFSEVDSFLMRIDCLDPASNDECHGATQISTDDIVSGVNRFSVFNTPDSCFYLGFNGDVQLDIWYRFAGNDQLMEFVFNRSVNGASFAILEGDCQNLNCVYILPAFDYNEQHSTKIFFAKELEYYIKIFSGSANSNEQRFQFQFNPIVIAPNDQSCTAYMLSCGDMIYDSTTNATINEFGCDGNELPSPGIWYKVIGNDQYYELIGQYEVENDLFYTLNPNLFTGTCNQLICQSDKLYRYQNKFVFYGKKGQTYYVLFHDQIPIKLRFNCLNDLGNDQIFSARRISCGDTYSGYGFNAKREDYALCGGRSDALKDIWFRIVGNDEYLFVNEGIGYLPLNSYYSDIYIKYGIFYKCSGSFQGNRIFLKKGVEYYIRLIIGEPTSGAGFERDFQVTFTCQARIANDDCATSIPLTCDQTVVLNTEYASDDPENLCGESYFGSRNVWFSVDGDNSFKELNIARTDGTFPGIQTYLFSGQCGQLECLGTGHFFYAEAGRKYYFNLGGSAFYGELQISLQCSDGAENDLCHEALPISCGEQVTGTFNHVKPCDYADPCRDMLYYKRVWYQFTGDGSLINLKLATTAFNSHLVRVAVFSGGCCNPEEITYTHIGDREFNGRAHKDVYFLSKPGSHYLIAAEQFFITTEDAGFNLTLSCLNLNDFHLCENAAQLQSGIETDIEVGDYFNVSVFNPLFGLVKWKGTGSLDTLTLYGESNVFPNASFAFLPDGECALRLPISGSTASEIYRDEQKAVYVLPTLSGQDYLIRVGRGPNYSAPVDMLRLIMKRGSEANSCAIILPGHIKAMTTDQPITVPFNMIGTEFPIDLFIRDAEDGPTYYNTFFGTQNIELYSEWTEGIKLVEFFNETCRGYGLFNLGFTDLPDHICPDSIYCPDQIIHLGVPLNSNIYQAQFIIESNAQIVPGSQVIYQTTQQILLNPGFEVFRGATLQVDLGGCREETLQIQQVSQSE